MAKKIMFSSKCGLTQAVLEGRKTMTRRIYNLTDADKEYLDTAFDWDLRESVIIDRYAKYKVGEVVAVAQSYYDVYEELKRTHGSSSSITRNFFHKYIQGGRMPVSNKMFVKSYLMLHQIRITDIKVERLQDISERDCIKEGVFKDQMIPIHADATFRDEKDIYYPFHNIDPYNWHYDYKKAFAALIDKVSGKGTWERNPWVFAYTFELVK